MHDLHLTEIDGRTHLVIPLENRRVTVAPIGEKERKELKKLEQDVQRIASGKPGRRVTNMMFARHRMSELALGPVAKEHRDNGATMEQMKLATSVATVWHLRGFEFCQQGWRELLGSNAWH